jgi:DNA-binding transcriptional LysR family regulator
MNVSFADMLLYVDVVREASFTGAAKRQGISKQVVSERMNKLEKALGVRLLQRTTRSLHTTDAGGRYFEYCAAIAQQVEQANLAMQAEQSEPTGLLRVSAPVLYGRGQLIPAIKTFTQRYPKVHVDLRLADRLVNLVDEGVDVALRVSHLSDSSLSVRKLGAVSAYFVASPRLLDQYGTLDHVQMIRNAPAVTFREGEIWDLPAGVKIKPHVRLNVNDISSVASAAVQGIGIARLPGIVCQPLAAKGELAILLNALEAGRMEVYAVYVSKRQLSPKIRSFIDVLLEHKLDFVEHE